jgi:hypothetical protein
MPKGLVRFGVIGEEAERETGAYQGGSEPKN